MTYSDDDARFDAWVTGNWGEDSVNRDDECPTCEGRGYFEYGPLKLDCADCQGTGLKETEE